MATPQGAVAKLGFFPETSYGAGATLSSTTGYRMYYDTLTDETRKNPLDLQEISGLSVDYQNWEEGEVASGFSLTHSMRYSGIHAAILACAMGDIVTTGGSSTWSHQVDLHDSLVRTTPTYRGSVTFLHQIPVTDNSTFVDNTYTGMVPRRMVLSHRAGDVMKCRTDWIGQGLTYDESAFTDWPSTAKTRIPSEPFITWSHKGSSATAFKVHTDLSSEDVALDVRSWEVTLDNGIEPNYLIQYGRTAGAPSRENFRSVTARLEIEQNAGYQQFINNCYKASATAAQSRFAIVLSYVDPDTAAQLFTLTLANCNLYQVPRTISGPGRIYQTVEMRAHYETGGYPFANPMRITVGSTVEGDWETEFTKA